MIREEFDKKVLDDCQKFEQRELLNSQEELLNDSYIIAKRRSILDYLLNQSDTEIEKLYPYADTILSTLSVFDCKYDTPQWTTWDNIKNMVNDFLVEVQNMKEVSETCETITTNDVQRLKQLIATNNVARDADTVLANILDDIDVEVSGTAYELICIWEDSIDKVSVEQTFESLTGVTFKDFIKMSLDEYSVLREVKK